MIEISLPGARWEVEFIADGSIDIERYESVARVKNEPGLLETIFEDSDPHEEGMRARLNAHGGDCFGDRISLG
jgi:hypothetical protein